jgi:hypothetical protein
MKSHEWLMIARSGVLQYMLAGEVDPLILEAIDGLLHRNFAASHCASYHYVSKITMQVNRTELSLDNL